MRFEMAPLEGITTYIYRNAHAKYFGKLDKYYTPFLSLHKEKEFSHKELNEILPEHNEGIDVIPQVLTNSAADFLKAAGTLREMGYGEININLGCPSGTVTAKGKGAGMLEHPEKLDAFLEEIFSSTPTDISIKTRLGIEQAEEWDRLLEIYNKYPLKELIVHARVREDFYKNRPNWDAFAKALSGCRFPVCYNGDIFTAVEYEKLTQTFPALEHVMLGRGLIQNPALSCELKKNSDSIGTKNNCDEKIRLRKFHDELYAGYQKIQSGEKNILFRMKELWVYMIQFFENAEKYSKKIRKANRCTEYESVIDELFRNRIS